MAERSEEDVLAGVLRIEVGDGVRVVPTLKAKYVGEWMARFAPPAGAKERPLRDLSVADVVAIPAQNVERLVDLMVAYDRTGVLGGRDWLLEHADPAQLQRAVEQMVANANPFADAQSFLGLMLIRAAGSAQPSSTSGRSTTGASTRTRSGSGSTRNS